MTLNIIFAVSAAPGLGRPWLALLVCAWLDYMSPQMLCYGFAGSIPWVQIIAGVTAIGFVISVEKIRLPVTRETILLLAFIIWITLTTFFALNQTETWDAWSRAIKIQIFIIGLLCIMNTPWRINALVWVIAASIGYYGF